VQVQCFRFVAFLQSMVYLVGLACIPNHATLAAQCYSRAISLNIPAVDCANKRWVALAIPDNAVAEEWYCARGRVEYKCESEELAEPPPRECLDGKTNRGE
jgi:hypothetical protein